MTEYINIEYFLVMNFGVDSINYIGIFLLIDAGRATQIEIIISRFKSKLLQNVGEIQILGHLSLESFK